MRAVEPTPRNRRIIGWAPVGIERPRIVPSLVQSEYRGDSSTPMPT